MHKWLYSTLTDFYIKRVLALLCIAGGYAYILVSDSALNHRHINLCWFKHLTGVPCPGCGMGRATLSLLKGEIPASWHFNILCIPFSIFTIMFFVGMIVDIIYRRDIFFSKATHDVRPVYKYGIYFLLLIDWVTNISRHI